MSESEQCLSREELDELRAMIAKGVVQADRGEATAWDPVEFKRRLREHLSNLHRRDPKSS